MKKLLFILFFPALLASWETVTEKNHIIEGTIQEENGNPVPNADIYIKRFEIKASTDKNGSFYITLPRPCGKLVITAPQFEEKTIKVCEESPQMITLKRMEVSPGALIDEMEVTESFPVMKEKTDHSFKSGQIAMDSRSKGRSPAYRSRGIVNQSYVDLPIQHQTENYDRINENRFLEVTQKPLSTFSIDVDAASYSNLRRFINNGTAPIKDAVRIEEMINYFNYKYPMPNAEHPFAVITELSDCPWNEQHRLLHIGLQGKKIPTDALPVSNLVFLIDVSGSMNQANKLPLLQSSFKLLTDQLRAEDKVAIVVYAGAAGVVLPATSGANKIKIKDAIGQLQAGGSTAGGAGIKLAYKIARENFVEGGNNRIILATDGDFNIGASSDAEMVRLIEEERKSGVYLTVLGYGMGNYKDNKMQQLANKGNGNHAYIDNLQEAKKVLVSEFGGTMFTIAKDVKIQVEFNPAKVQGYRLIGYENRMLEAEDFNDDQKDAGELGSGHTVTALYEIIPTGVESDFIASVDPLKYQKSEIDPKNSRSNELMTVKLRYKKPDGDKSKLIEKTVFDYHNALANASENFLWSAAVAEFGMLLRESEFRQKATYQQAIQLAKKAKGRDENGYRAEMIRMMEEMTIILEPGLAEKN